MCGNDTQNRSLTGPASVVQLRDSIIEDVTVGPRTILAELCGRLGIIPPAQTVHAFRHTFVVNYLRKGGSVFHLQKMLGHSTLEMARRYANLTTEDLQQIHEKVSLLSGR